MSKMCGRCKYWGRDEPRPVNFAACRYPLPEAVLEYIANGTDENGTPAFMKVAHGGGNCEVFAEDVDARMAELESLMQALQRSNDRLRQKLDRAGV
jgi:hypothetical protein